MRNILGPGAVSNWRKDPELLTASEFARLGSANRISAQLCLGGRWLPFRSFITRIRSPCRGRRTNSFYREGMIHILLGLHPSAPLLRMLLRYFLTRDKGQVEIIDAVASAPDRRCILKNIDGFSRVATMSSIKCTH